MIMEIIKESPLQQGEIVYEIVKELAAEDQGRNSKVYIVNDKQMNADLVLKKMLFNPSLVDQFKESKLLYKYRHSNVVAIQYACLTDHNNCIGIFSPYYMNGTLKTKICNGQNLTVKQVIRYAIQFLRGLHHIHKDGLIHQDIKPDNIMISDRDEAMISDFGLAEYYNEEKENIPKHYMCHWSPEYIKSENRDIRSDIYQVGLTLFRLVNGYDRLENEIIAKRYKHAGELANDIVKGKFPAKDYLNHIPISLTKIINKCLKVDPDERYQNTLQLIKALSNIDDSPSINWIYSIDKEQSITWKRCINDVSLLVVCAPKKDGTFDLLTTKTGTKEQRVTKYCCNNLSIPELNIKLKSLFKEL